MIKNTGLIKFKIKLGKFESDIKLDPPQKNILALTGKSGSGKSTVAKVLCGIIKPQSGEIIINNKILFSSEKKINLSPHLRNIGMVFQENRLFTHMSVKSNLLYSQRRKKLSNTKLFDKTIELLDIRQLLNRKVLNLSGGEAQRVSIGRAILSDPKLLILDEPLSGLDIERQHNILSIIKNINIESKIPILFISHSLDEIVYSAESIALIENGKILTQGPVNDILSNKKTIFYNLENEEGTVLKCKIIAQNLEEKITTISIKHTEIIMSKIPEAVGSDIAIRLLAKDISLATEKPKNISINNILEARILEIYESKNIGSVNVELKVGKNIIIARILQSSSKKLKLKTNDKVFALIKSISIVGRTNNN